MSVQSEGGDKSEGGSAAYPTLKDPSSAPQRAPEDSKQQAFGIQTNSDGDARMGEIAGEFAVRVPARLATAD